MLDGHQLNGTWGLSKELTPVRESWTHSPEKRKARTYFVFTKHYQQQATFSILRLLMKEPSQHDTYQKIFIKFHLLFTIDRIWAPMVYV